MVGRSLLNRNVLGSNLAIDFLAAFLRGPRSLNFAALGPISAMGVKTAVKLILIKLIPAVNEYCYEVSGYKKTLT